MSVIHRTTLKPTKLELLTAWLPTQPWYRGGATPAKAGGFRLDDPEGEVGIELMIVTDTADAVDRTVHVGITPGATDVEIARLLDSHVDDGPGTVTVPWRAPDGGEHRSVVLRAS